MYVSEGGIEVGQADFVCENLIKILGRNNR